MIEIGRRIREMRISREISQLDLGKATGLSQREISYLRVYRIGNALI